MQKDVFIIYGYFVAPGIALYLIVRLFGKHGDIVLRNGESLFVGFDELIDRPRGYIVRKIKSRKPLFAVHRYIRVERHSEVYVFFAVFVL